MSIPVIFNHSAAIDDFVATALLTTMPHINLKAVVVTDADCLTDQGMQTTYKVHQFLGLSKDILFLSNARGWNPFPYLYREDCFKMGKVPSLQRLSGNPDWPPYPSGEAAIQQFLMEAIQTSKPIKLLVTGPLTTLANALTGDVSLVKGIDEIIWMGGAVEVEGNLMPATVPNAIRNKVAEWNAFWDPFAVDFLFRLIDKIRVFPLDITNQATLDPKFLLQLKKQGQQYRFSQMIYEAYSLVAALPDYDMWNTLAASYLAQNIAFLEEPEPMQLDVVTWGFDQGCTKKVPFKRHSANRQLVYTTIRDISQFYDFLLNQFRK